MEEGGRGRREGEMEDVTGWKEGRCQLSDLHFII